ncbi:hypothetical protein GCM10007981_17970 [Thermocladium modestius]|uniref:CRISPR type III-associated protein domain-containing protein n=1 Tax=Thermocladium modestius TaxID=62609 RepID=A0A830GYI8_9CREN|nr:RAMP superfamily CRISPR-associated protein [Thermocladium modestius]GGP22332.1 hypothetical protein GCM10007981_17970 [Thermocladium modestius]
MQRFNSHSVIYTDRSLPPIMKIPVTLSIVSEYLHISEDPKPLLSVKINGDVSKVINDFILGKKPNLDAYFERDYVRFMSTEKGLVIPGNTVKGAIRSRLELLMDCACYNSLGNRPSKSKSNTYISIYHPKRKQSDRFDPYRNKYICYVCNLFGNAGLASRVNFSDLEFQEGKVDFITIKGIIYEVARRGSTFKGNIILDNPQPHEIGMLLYGAGYRGQGKWKTLLLGRFKYEMKDFGRVKFNIQINNADSYLNAFLSLHKGHIHDVEEDWK